MCLLHYNILFSCNSNSSSPNSGDHHPAPPLIFSPSLLRVVASVARSFTANLTAALNSRIQAAAGRIFFFPVWILTWNPPTVQKDALRTPNPPAETTARYCFLFKKCPWLKQNWRSINIVVERPSLNLTELPPPPPQAVYINIEDISKIYPKPWTAFYLFTCWPIFQHRKPLDLISVLLTQNIKGGSQRWGEKL